MVFNRSLLFLCLAALAKAQVGYPRDGGYDSYYRGGRPFNPEDPLSDVVYGDEIPGVAGIDYPVLTEVPPTGFNCGLQLFPGYYADPAAYCQAFYVCTGSGRGTGFLCPNGTVFNQETLVCDWWYNFDCGTAVSLYGVNADITRAVAAVDAASAGARARGLGVLPPRDRFSETGGSAVGPYGAVGALGGRRRPLATVRQLSSPRPGGYRNNAPGASRGDSSRGYNNAPYGGPVGGAYNQYTDRYNGPSSFDNSFAGAPGYGGPGSSYGSLSRGGFGSPGGAAPPDRQYLPPY